MGGSALAWILSLSALPALWLSLTGQAGQPITIWGLDDAAQRYPQLVAYGFLLGAALWFGLRVPASSVQTTDAAPVRKFDTWLRCTAIALLGGILVLAVYERCIVPLTLPNTINPSDFDEGLLAQAALMVTKGNTLYRDIFFNQPPTAVFIWSLPLRFGHSIWGSIPDLLWMRLWTAILSLLTVVLAYLIGRRLAGPIAGLIAALVLTVDGGTQHFDQRLIFEPLINLGLAAMLLAFLYDAPDARGQRRWLPLFLAGLIAGLTITIKVPALVGAAAILLTLLFQRRWRDSLFVGASTLLGFVPINLLYLFLAGGDFIKQVYISRILEPVNSFSLTDHTDDTRFFGFIYKTPYVQFTVILAALGLAAIIAHWLRGRAADRWLPIVLLAILTVYLYSSKGGWSRHYYDQIALPLALLAGGVVLLWLPRWHVRWRGRLIGIVGAVVLGWLTLPYLTIAAQATVSGEDKVIYAVRAMNAHDLDEANATLWAWSSNYAFVTGHSMPHSADGRYIVDYNGYSVYTALGLDRLSLGASLGLLFNPPQNLPHPLSAAPNLQTAVQQAQDASRYVLIEDALQSYFTDETMARLAQHYTLITDNNDVSIYARMGHIMNIPPRNGVAFLGYDSPDSVAAGSGLKLQLYWRATAGKIENDVAAISLTDSTGKVVARSETVTGAKSSNWNVNGILYDRQALRIPATTAPGTYHLSVDFFVPQNGSSDRSNTVDPAQAALHADLGSVTLTAQAGH